MLLNFLDQSASSYSRNTGFFMTASLGALPTPHPRALCSFGGKEKTDREMWVSDKTSWCFQSVCDSHRCVITDIHFFVAIKLSTCFLQPFKVVQWLILYLKVIALSINFLYFITIIFCVRRQQAWQLERERLLPWLPHRVFSVGVTTTTVQASLSSVMFLVCDTL